MKTTTETRWEVKAVKDAGFGMQTVRTETISNPAYLEGAIEYSWGLKDVVLVTVTETTSVTTHHTR